MFQGIHIVEQDLAHPSCVKVVALSQGVLPSSEQEHSPSYLCVLCFWQAVAALNWKCLPAWKTGAYCASSEGRPSISLVLMLHNACHGAHLGPALELLLDALSTHGSIAFCLFLTRFANTFKHPAPAQRQ